MAEKFEFRDLSDAEFWGVDLRRATFRDVDLSGAQISHARLVDVRIDAEIDRVVVNGVDVTTYVNERDEWYRLRSRIRPTDVTQSRDAWHVFADAWTATIERARALPDAQHRASVEGEWSILQTIRHLVFGIDKWCTAAILGGTFHPIGLPNSGSANFGWPGIDPTADPGFDEAVAVWHDRMEQLRAYLDGVDPAALDRRVAVLENGPHAIHDCIGVVYEEHFEHLRYARRDLDRLTAAEPGPTA